MSEPSPGSAPLAPAQEASPPSVAHHAPPAGHGFHLALAALGVVYGDIGTSPLYAIKECLHSEHALEVSRANVLGVLSLIFYALTFVVTIKYLGFIMRADNQGEGGILALLALVPQEPDKKKKAGLLALLVVFGAALLYGDGMITPAISVLSAMEGLNVATPAAKDFVVPGTVAILLGLFLVQRRGTAGVGKVFGPVMLVWFGMIAVLGIVQIARDPAVFHALDPRYAVNFFLANKGKGFLVLGAVVLSITGAEALYADMGHFGREPIRRTWFFLVFPSLLLCYFGQGAHLLSNPAAVDNPFYSIVPAWMLYPAVAIATAATVVASQALISGAYSLTQQAVQLGFFPRVTIVHTSKDTEGQIYVPEINTMLLVACVGLVLAFGSSSKLAAAYGIAVTGTMSITTVVYYVVATRTWRWPLWKAAPLAALFLAVDLAFFGSTAVKFADGGWFPILIAAGIYTVMTTWNTGRRYLGEMLAEAMMPLDLFLADVESSKPTRVKGSAVFMASNPNGVPVILLHHFKHNQVLHEQVILLTVVAKHVPEIPSDQRIRVQDLGHGFYRVTITYGFMQTPDIPRVLRDCAAHGLVLVPERTSYYLGRETLLPSGASRMARWRKQLFAFISRNARPATAYFGLPPNRVVELGMQVDL